eukprot:2754807-Amphidinium_carterae.2
MDQRFADGHLCRSTSSIARQVVCTRVCFKASAMSYIAHGGDRMSKREHTCVVHHSLARLTCGQLAACWRRQPQVWHEVLQTA